MPPLCKNLAICGVASVSLARVGGNGPEVVGFFRCWPLRRRVRLDEVMIYTRKSVSSLPPEDSPMTTASTVSRSANAKVATKPGANSALVPPDEQFWQHYSPHYEAPISGVSSLMVHVLVVGLFVGLGILAAIWGWNR